MSTGLVTPIPEDLVTATDIPPSASIDKKSLTSLLPGLQSQTVEPSLKTVRDHEHDEMRAKIRAHVGQSLRALGEQKRRNSRRICGLTRADIFQWIRAMLFCSDADSLDDAADDSDSKISSTKKFLRGVEELSSLTGGELSQLARLAEMRSFRRDDVIVANEEHANGLYIVMSGKAARAFMVQGQVDETLPIESIEYQEAFGMNIPALIRDDSRIESSVTAVSEHVECIWLPHLVVRMLNLEPRMEYEFVLILKNPSKGKDSDLKQQESILTNILQAGIHVTVMANTRNTCDKIILLLNAPLWLLAREDKLMKMERIVEYHSEEDAKCLGDEYSSNADSMTAADRISAFASILTRPTTDHPPGVGLRGIENNQDAMVHDIFPLHDPNVNDFITSSWFKEALSTSTRRLFLLRTKDHFGLQIAFYMAFVRLYCSALSTPCVVGILLWIIWRQAHYWSYMQALGIFGLLVAFVWAPSVLKRWKRYQHALLVEWDLIQAKEVEYPNHEFKNYVVETINVASEGDTPDYVDIKTYDRRRRYPKYISFGIFAVICCLLLFVFVGLYCQWYIIAVMTPMCDDPRCPKFLDANNCITQCELLIQQGKTYNFLREIRSSVRGCTGYCDLSTFDPSYYSCDTALVGCFATERGIVGTARWTYVLVQGIALGLTLDIIFLAIFEQIASVFNKWENYATMQENERRFVEKIFVFNWVGYFYWFFLLCFLYTPYGENVQAYIRENIDTKPWLTANGKLKFSRYWVSGLVAMDSAFVTPLIVTQALNLLINTFVPYLLRRAVIRARDAYLVKKDELSLKLKNGLKPAQNVVDLNQNASKESAIRLGELQLQTSSKTEKDAKEMKLHLVATSGQNDFDLTELEKEELALHLAEKRPIRAADLESTAVYLFGNLSRHHNHMSRICSNIRREELDEYQVKSYDWIDRVTQYIGHNKKHENIWEDSLHKTKNQPSFRLRLIKDWHCRKYIYNADRIMEESSMSVYSPQGDLLHMAIQFSYVTMFSVIWPFCALCAYCNNAVATRFDTIKMVIDCKRAVPRRVVGIGPWFGAFMLETLVATMVVPAIFVYVTGQMDAFSSTCTISETNYGPVTNCYSPIYRLIAFCLLENIGIGICFFVYLRKKDISRETSIKMQEHSRRVKYSVRKSVRTIGEHILVDVNEGEWRQGTVAWVQNGRVKVNFHTNEGFGEVSHSTEHEAWLDKERYVLKAPIPVRIFDMGMPVLLASAKKGIWLEGNIVGLDLVNRSGKELAYSPNEMHLSILEGRNLKSYMLRNVLDPYCVVTCGTFKHMTTIKRHTLNPLWNEYLVFTMTKKDMSASNGKLRLSVYNHDALSLGECIGEAEIDMSDHINGQRTKLWVPLLLKKNGLNVELLGNAVHKLALGDDCFEPQLLIEIQWIDSRFPAQVQVKVKQDGEEVMPRVLTRKQCETRLCYGFHSHEIKEGRIYDSNIAQ
ncbi:hypothetical protein LEN26_017719 [Aphanomyces euteiches]|nr:hypothetical protein LEN26_017719 [Aphanomyces euteiches]